MHFSLRLLPLLMAGWICLPIGALSAEDASHPVRTMLEAGWEKGLDAFKAAEAEYAKLEESSTPDVNVQYAFALVQLKHHRYSGAEKLFQEILKREPAHLGARRSLIWLAVVRREYEQALANMTKWAELVGDRPEAERAEAARFTGAVIGFLRGPAEKSVAQTAVDTAAQRMQAALGVEPMQTFAATQANVRQQYLVMTGQLQQSKAQAIQEQQKEIEETQTELEQAKEEVGKEKGDLQSAAEQAESEVQTILAEIDEKLVPLNQQFARLSGQAGVIQNRIALLSGDIARLQAEAEATDDEIRRGQLLRAADRLILEVSAYQRQYDALDLQARQVNAARATLAGQRQAAIAQYQQRMKALGLKYKNLERQDKILDVQKRKNQKSAASGNTASVRSLRRKATAFTSYVELPIEQERQQLLDALSK